MVLILIASNQNTDDQSSGLDVVEPEIAEDIPAEQLIQPEPEELDTDAEVDPVEQDLSQVNTDSDSNEIMKNKAGGDSNITAQEEEKSGFWQNIKNFFKNLFRIK